jgi:transcriptional regulator with XRE-family HTH domain
MRRRQLGSRLREMREEAAKSLDEVAAHLECSAAKVSRIETGRVGARALDVRSMMDFYDTPDTLREELLALVRGSRQRPWWSKYAEHIPENLSTVIGLTEDASTIDSYACYLVPGLLQTRAYGHAVADRRKGFTEEEYARFIDLRIARQQVLSGGNPPQARFLLDEIVLRRPLNDAAVRRDQLEHLLGMARQPNIKIRVIPLNAGLSAAMGLAFTLLGFPQPGQPSVAHADLMTGVHIVERPADVCRYQAVFSELHGLALDASRSMELIADLSAHWRNPYHQLVPPEATPTG